MLITRRMLERAHTRVHSDMASAEARATSHDELVPFQQRVSAMDELLANAIAYELQVVDTDTLDEGLTKLLRFLLK